MPRMGDHVEYSWDDTFDEDEEVELEGEDVFVELSEEGGWGCHCEVNESELGGALDGGEMVEMREMWMRGAKVARPRPSEHAIFRA